ncbi:hypothetical protein Ancab_021447, partial [Ancistrocladus abbreviatus]
RLKVLDPKTKKHWPLKGSILTNFEPLQLLPGSSTPTRAGKVGTVEMGDFKRPFHMVSVRVVPAKKGKEESVDSRICHHVLSSEARDN